MSDERGRHLEAPPHFLDEGRSYVAEIYRDVEQADWATNPYDLVRAEVLVTSSDVLPLRLAAGGGQAVRFRPATGDDIDRLSP